MASTKKRKPSSWPRGGCFLIVVRMDKEFALMQSRGSLLGFTTLQGARDHFEIPYDSRHGSTYERSMSACIHYVFFAPRVVHIRTQKELKALAAKPGQIIQLTTVAGSMAGILLKRKEGRQLYKKATPVRLIKSEDEYAERYGSLDADPA